MDTSHEKLTFPRTSPKWLNNAVLVLLKVDSVIF